MVVAKVATFRRTDPSLGQAHRRHRGVLVHVQTRASRGWRTSISTSPKLGPPAQAPRSQRLNGALSLKRLELTSENQPVG